MPLNPECWLIVVARYLQAVKRYLENPLTIAFG